MILSKQPQEIIFSCKIEKTNHAVSIVNNIAVNQTPHQKDLGMFLDDKLKPSPENHMTHHKIIQQYTLFSL